jgi:hypothetical protein
MPGELLELVGFTLLPLGALLVGIGLAVGASYVLRDRRILLAGLLFALMASHQVTEIRRLLAGGDPHQNLLGELFETAVNLLAVTAIAYIVGSLSEERRLKESLDEVQQSLLEDRPGRTRQKSVPNGDTGASAGEGMRNAVSEWFGLKGGTTAALVFGQRSPVDAVLSRAVDDARITFPIATFEVKTTEAVEVVAETTYLQEIFEILLEQLVLYNDTSDPVISVAVHHRNGTVAVRFSHNGSGLPDDVRGVLETGEDTSRTDLAELVFVETFVSKWGGSVSVEEGVNGAEEREEKQAKKEAEEGAEKGAEEEAEDELVTEPAITVTLATPRFAGLLD